jgi:hypothetical protein
MQNRRLASQHPIGRNLECSSITNVLLVMEEHGKVAPCRKRHRGILSTLWSSTLVNTRNLPDVDILHCFVIATWSPGYPIFAPDMPNRPENEMLVDLVAEVPGSLASAPEPFLC